MRQQKADGENGNSSRTENIVSKGNRQETNMAIHFLKPEALALCLSLYLSLSLNRCALAVALSQQQTYSKHIVDEQRRRSAENSVT